MPKNNKPPYIPGIYDIVEILNGGETGNIGLVTGVFQGGRIFVRFDLQTTQVFEYYLNEYKVIGTKLK